MFVGTTGADRFRTRGAHEPRTATAIADAGIGGALAFDGIDDFVAFGQGSPTLSDVAGDRLTVDGWIRADAVSGTSAIIGKNGPFALGISGSLVRRVTDLAPGTFTFHAYAVDATGATCSTEVRTVELVNSP